jgi:hypothetical protein
MGCLHCYRASLYLVSLLFTIDSWIMYNYYTRWFNANHVHGTIMPRQSSIDASNKVAQAVSTSDGIHKTVRRKDLKAASDQMRMRVGHEEMARHWSVGEDDDME